MIIWVILFILIIGTSFVLAFRSMKDYQEFPQKQVENYGLYLVRSNQSLTANVLDSIRLKLASHVGVLSLERLFKNNKTVLCIFGPKIILDDVINDLQLLELEEYTVGLDYGDIDIWEVGIKGDGIPENTTNIFKDIPLLDGKDQFFWQIIIGSKGVQIRAAVFSENIEKRKLFVSWFEGIASGRLIKVPRPYSTEQMLNFYRLRSLGADFKKSDYSSVEIMRLLKI